MDAGQYQTRDMPLDMHCGRAQPPGWMHQSLGTPGLRSHAGGAETEPGEPTATQLMAALAARAGARASVARTLAPGRALPRSGCCAR